ncbi:MAG: MATE family efflux transporter [Lentisphaeria bacterium]|nr:MATE family efflux transporter [Lentisphaeria bacterium]
MATSAANAVDRRDLVSGSLTRSILRLSLPLAIGMVLHGFYNLIDAFWLGRVSREALAAPGVSGPLVWLIVSFGMGFGGAATALVAQYTGAGRHREADHVAGQAFVLGTVWSVVLALPMAIMARHVLGLFRVPGEMMPEAVGYLGTVVLGLPFVSFTMAYGAVLRALGDTVTPVLIGVGANLINLILDPLLIFGWGGFPALGVQGAAIATVLSQMLGALVCYVMLRRHHRGISVRRGDIRPDWPLLRRLWGIGLPSAISNGSGSLGFSLFQGMINTLGTTVIGAFTVGFRLASIFQMPAQALGMAAAPIVGQALGAGRPALARRAIGLSAAMVAIGMLGPVVFLMFEGRLVAGFFTRDAEVVRETGRFFLIVPLSSYLFGIIMVLTAAFHGSGHTRPAMFLMVLRMWGLRLPAGYLLGFVLGWGSVGVYWGMVLGNAVAAVVAYLMFRQCSWHRGALPPGVIDAPCAADGSCVRDSPVP